MVARITSIDVCQSGLNSYSLFSCSTVIHGLSSSEAERAVRYEIIQTGGKAFSVRHVPSQRVKRGTCSTFDQALEKLRQWCTQTDAEVDAPHQPL
jgi:hypothetical protein